MGDDAPVSISERDLLPDRLATIILALCMGEQDFEAFRSRDEHIIYVHEEVDEPEALRDLYTVMLRIVEVLLRRYETSLEEDLESLSQVEAYLSETVPQG